jgi:hypothetical protein
MSCSSDRPARIKTLLARQLINHTELGKMNANRYLSEFVKESKVTYFFKKYFYYQKIQCNFIHIYPTATAILPITNRSPSPISKHYFI